eukprot:354542-Chlamydomonas_euryale.AAC.12
MAERRVRRVCPYKAQVVERARSSPAVHRLVDQVARGTSMGDVWYGDWAVPSQVRVHLRCSLGGRCGCVDVSNVRKMRSCCHYRWLATHSAKCTRVVTTGGLSPHSGSAAGHGTCQPDVGGPSGVDMIAWMVGVATVGTVATGWGGGGGRATAGGAVGAATGAGCIQEGTPRHVAYSTVLHLRTVRR